MESSPHTSEQEGCSLRRAIATSTLVAESESFVRSAFGGPPAYLPR